MTSQHEDREQAADTEPDPEHLCPHCGAARGVREPEAGDWPETEEAARMAVQHNLEQIGEILRRLELNKPEIAQLRTRTRAILAELAA